MESDFESSETWRLPSKAAYGRQSFKKRSFKQFLNELYHGKFRGKISSWSSLMILFSLILVKKKRFFERFLFRTPYNLRCRPTVVWLAILTCLFSLPLFIYFLLFACRFILFNEQLFGHLSSSKQRWVLRYFSVESGGSSCSVIGLQREGSPLL